MSAEEWNPATANELARLVGENFSGPRLPLLPCGGRTSLRSGYAVPTDSIQVATTELASVIDYPSRDLTITVEAGLRVAELQEHLAREQQRLPIDIPQAHRATIGGAIASNASGPGRYGYGTFRDYVIGISAVDGQGRLFSAGGRVVKNVAGYDLCKLLIGSLGTLATITQVTLKVRPQAACRGIALAAVATAGEADTLLAALNTSATRPVALDVLNARASWQLRRETRQDLSGQFVLCIAFEGSQQEVDWQTETVLAELGSHREARLFLLTGDDADHLWEALTEYQAASDDPLTFQASLPPSRTMSFIEQATAQGIAIQAHAGNGIVIGHLPDRCVNAAVALEMVRPLRQSATMNGGTLTVLNCDDEWKKQINVFGAETPDWKLMRSIKSVLDPANLLSPGRLW